MDVVCVGGLDWEDEMRREMNEVTKGVNTEKDG